MVGLVVHHLERTNPELIPETAGALDVLRQAHVRSDFKRDVLDFVWRQAGAETLLSIGQGVRTVGYDPIWAAALCSANPAVFFDKWQRFEVFAHSRNRVRIAPTAENRASFQRYTVHGGMPTTPENLLVCGLIIALLEAIGCRGLRCDMPLRDGTVFCVRDNLQFRVPADAHTLATTAWTIDWRAFAKQSDNTNGDIERPEIVLPRSCDATLKASVEAVVQVLMRDVARRWKVAELARETGFSTRSLQRRFGEADISFSSLVRLVRIHESCRLLKDPALAVTTVGLCAGFSDSAHFSRDFRASTGMTPSDYRAALVAEVRS